MIKRTAAIVATICFLFLCPTVFGQAAYTKEITATATSLYNSFSQVQNMSGRLNFSDTARLKWNNLPVGLRARVGTSIGNMTVDQRKMLHRILSASLSSQGYLKATSILHLDDLLNRYYENLYETKKIDSNTHNFMKGLLWSHKNFFFAFFGKPTDDTWGYKLEGHHLSINFTFVKNQLSVTPFFIGTDPAEYPDTEYAGWRVLGQEEDLGVKLINLLTPAQQKKATISTGVPGDIITAAESGKRLVEDRGIKGADMNKEQQDILKYIIREFVFNMEYDKAVIEYNKIEKAGIANVSFAWIGPYEEATPHYFVLNGPTFIVEFDNNGGPGNGSNHIHAIWREKGNEYGEDVLKKHYQTEKH